MDITAEGSRASAEAEALGSTSVSKAAVEKVGRTREGDEASGTILQGGAETEGEGARAEGTVGIGVNQATGKREITRSGVGSAESEYSSTFFGDITRKGEVAAEGEGRGAGSVHRPGLSAGCSEGCGNGDGTAIGIDRNPVGRAKGGESKRTASAGGDAKGGIGRLSGEAQAIQGESGVEGGVDGARADAQSAGAEDNRISGLGKKRVIGRSVEKAREVR